MTTDFNPFTALFTTSELSLSRALNSLLPPSVRAAEIPSFKPKSELGPDDHHSDGEGGSMISLKLFNVTHLPPREIVKRLATTLNSTLGITFFIVEPPAEVENLVDRVYSHCDHYNLARRQQRAYGLSMAAMKLPQPPSTCEICEILAMAAVGSQYDRQASASLRQACFHSARFGLDDAIEEAEEADAGDEVHYRVLRLLILLAIYQILEKRGSCWRYIGTALSIARKRCLDQYEGVTASLFHLRMRKLWRTLVCLESWIGATLGNLPTTTIDLGERITIGDPVFCYPEGGSYPALDSAEGSLTTRSLQIAVVRIAIVTAAIQRSIYPPVSSTGIANNSVDLVKTRVHMAALEQWFQALPHTLRLGALLPRGASTLAAPTADGAITFAESSSMLLGHCLYLSGLMLVTRRIFLSVINDLQEGYDILYRGGDKTNISLEKMECLGYVRSCLIAANLTGRIMGLMVSEGRLVSKCWLAIYAAFNACLLLLFHLTQRKLWGSEDILSSPEFGLPFQGEVDTGTVEENKQNANKCLAALEFCASGGDELSKWYLVVLAPFRKALGEGAESDQAKQTDTLSSDMYNMLAVSTQCAFRPEEPSRAAYVGAGYSGSDSRYAQDPLVSSPSIPSRTRLGTRGQEPTRRSLQSSQPGKEIVSRTRRGEEITRGRDPRRRRIEPVSKLDDATKAELEAFFKRVA